MLGFTLYVFYKAHDGVLDLLNKVSNKVYLVHIVSLQASY